MFTHSSIQHYQKKITCIFFCLTIVIHISGVLSRPSGSVPTAQVYPSPISNAKYNGNTESNGRTSGSMAFTSKNTWEDETISSTTTLTDTTILQTNGAHINTTRGDLNATASPKEDDFEELMASNMTLDTTQLFLGTKSVVPPYSRPNDALSRRHKELNSDLEELTRSASALSIGSHSVSNLSEPSLHLYGGEPGLPSALTRGGGPDMYSKHLQEKYQTQPQPSYNNTPSFEITPPAFQAASFVPSAHGSHLNTRGSSFMTHHTLPPSSFSRPGEYASGYSAAIGVGGGTSGLNFSSDLSQWQQNHQHQLHRQQMEAQQVCSLKFLMKKVIKCYTIISACHQNYISSSPSVLNTEDKFQSLLTFGIFRSPDEILRYTGFASVALLPLQYVLTCVHGNPKMLLWIAHTCIWVRIGTLV